MKSQARCYPVLREYVEALPIIDCHDHSKVCGPRPTDVVKAVFDWYMNSDLNSASSDRESAAIYDESVPLEERWPILERAWSRTCHTGYAEVTRRVLREFYGESAVTLEALQRVQEKLIDFSDESTFDSVLEKAHIVVRLEDAWPDVKAFLAGAIQFPPRSLPVISLPGYHAVVNHGQVQANASPLNRSITSLDEYVDTCRAIFSSMKSAGAVAFKDQSAYSRPLDYGNPSRSQAEEAFNWMMEDPRRSLSYPDGNRPLGDYLFHQFMRIARDLELPVQIHTGHMAGIRNEIAKTNAVHLTRLLELHRDTRFDLFHANWPYGGEILFLIKNYPNAAIDFCWTHMVDPYYSQELLRQAVFSVPHGKIHGFGSDLAGDTVTSAWAHADLARDNISMALADLVEIEYLDLDDAKNIAYDWLF
ncbi:MAG: amidohydrolase family protein, partial [Anaerolineaceae bacterium]|nr:amidohydrolase family protein [Anaerolineaceae bacterium]